MSVITITTQLVLDRGCIRYTCLVGFEFEFHFLIYIVSNCEDASTNSEVYRTII